jgi:transcriptional regulator with XRE-family HTH domain
MTTIGERIRARRDEANLSLAELARRVGISKGYLHNLESGDAASPSAEILFRIANELGTTIADLMGEAEQLVSRAKSRIPDSLRNFAIQANLPEKDIQMLANIEYRGKQPENEDDWRYIYESIKRTIRQSNEQKT